MLYFRMLCLIVVPISPGKNPLTVQLHDNNKNISIIQFMRFKSYGNIGRPLVLISSSKNAQFLLRPSVYRFPVCWTPNYIHSIERTKHGVSIVPTTRPIKRIAAVRCGLFFSSLSPLTDLVLKKVQIEVGAFRRFPTVNQSSSSL
jgi:hypothetical protein